MKGIIVAVLLILGGAPALAQTPAYVGTWAVNPAHCRNGQESENAPLAIGARRYDQHEAHCEFTSVRQDGARWRIRAQCMVEGSRQPENFSLSVSGNRLTKHFEDGASVTFQRCR